MFGNKATGSAALKAPPKANAPAPKPDPTSVADAAAATAAAQRAPKAQATDEYYETKATIFNALFETIDVSALAGMQPDKARTEIRTIVDEIIAIRNVRLSVAEQSQHRNQW